MFVEIKICLTDKTDKGEIMEQKFKSGFVTLIWTA